jgi:hypothetical protein
MHPLLRPITVLALLGLCTPAASFSGPAHRIIADLAEAGLSPAVRGEIRALLAEVPARSLAEVSTWADEVRAGDDPRFDGTGPWHYINFPRDGDCAYVPERDCPGDACIVEALKRQAAILGDRAQDRRDRREALKWVVHLVGDIHQPLHAGFGDDRGGNLFQVNYIGRGTNLHAVWDRLVFEVAGLDEHRYRDELAARPLPPGRLDWHPGAAAAWAEESCRLIGELQIYPRRQGRLSRAYLERMRPHAEARLQLAAARLAALLEATLAAMAPGDAHPAH